jgi:hypothetical protein
MFRSNVVSLSGREDSMRQIFVAAMFSLILVGPAKSEEEDHHLNHVSAFLGVTEEARRQGAGTLGLEYERRLGERWFIAPAIEHAFGDLDFSLVTLTVGYRFNRWAVYAGPGIEWGEHQHGGGSQTEREFLLRTGGLYELEVGDLVVAPHAMVDFVGDEEVALVGVTVVHRWRRLPIT